MVHPSTVCTAVRQYCDIRIEGGSLADAERDAGLTAYAAGMNATEWHSLVLSIEELVADQARKVNNLSIAVHSALHRP